MKKSTKITMIVGLTMLIMLATCMVALAATPAYTMKAPLVQDIGILDKPYGQYTEANCRECHGMNTADLHHMTPSALQTNDPTKGCVACHTLTAQGTVATPIDRNCTTVCHNTSWHHTTTMALAGTCTACHDPAILAEQGTGLVAPEKPTYDKSLVTPAVKDCANCHNDFNPDWNPATQTGSPNTKGPNGLSHHGTGLQICGFCHDSGTGPIDNILDVRMCESCHTITTLHTIVPHTSTPDANGVMKVDNNKCIGCHGTYMATLPQLNPTNTPAVSGLDTAVQKSFGYVVISGTNFGDSANFGTVTLTPTGSTTPVVANASYWNDTEIRVMIPEKLALGNYDLKVTVSGKASNVEGLTVVGNPRINSMAPAMGLASTATNPVYVTLQGTGFVNGTNLAVNFVQGSYKAAVTPQINANGDLVAQVPVGMLAGKYLVNVSNSIGTSNTVYYTVGTAPKVTLISPSAAKVGATVTITGSNLALGAKPTIKFGSDVNGAGGFVGTVKSYTATKIYVTVPSMTAGITNVKVYNGFANSAAVKFTVK